MRSNSAQKFPSADKTVDKGTMHLYEVRPRKDKRGVDLISVPPKTILIAGWQLIRPRCHQRILRALGRTALCD